MGLFSRKPKGEPLEAPAPGRLVALADIPDPVFAGGIMGPGFGVDIDSDEVCSPVDGTIVLVADTLHAFAVKSDGGAEILVHIGVDTVKLGGEGFTRLKAVGDRVHRGDAVIEVARESVRDSVPSLVTAVVLTNASDFAPFEPNLAARPGDAVVTLQRK